MKLKKKEILIVAFLALIITELSLFFVRGDFTLCTTHTDHRIICIGCCSFIKLGGWPLYFNPLLILISSKENSHISPEPFGDVYFWNAAVDFLVYFVMLFIAWKFSEFIIKKRKN